MHYFITDGRNFYDATDDNQIKSLLQEQTQIELVKKLAFILAENAAPIWYLGDGYGGEVWNIINWTFENYGLEKEPKGIKNKSNRKSISQGLRRTVYERDEYTCVKCGARKDLSIDHIIPVAKGGTNKLENLQTMCMSCNLKKGIK